jgi:hypothetical protein
MARDMRASKDRGAGGAAAVSSPPEMVPGESEHAFRAGRLGVGTAVSPAEELTAIPWGYGDDRVTALATDPAHLYVYWEVTDGAIDRARKGLGLGGYDAWLNLRVYDTTGRLFDGTNAHSYFDQRLDRSDRQFFFEIGKPGSDAFVDIGLMSSEGFFVKIARSGKIGFPRREPVGWADPEWMTLRVHTGEVVREGGTTPRGGAPGQGGQDESGNHGHGRGHGHGHGQGRAVAGAPGEWHETFEPAPLWHMHMSWEDLMRSGLQFGEQTSWEEVLRDGWFEGRRMISWDGPATVTSWEAGPFAYPVEVSAPVTDFIVGPTQSYQIGGRTHVVYGPWHVVIRGLGAHRTGQILQRWEIHRAWVSSEGRGVRAVGLQPRGGQAGASERMMGASEWVWLGASEERLGGASEVHYLGASEQRMLGASEILFQSASQWLLRGASERRFLGASEVRLRGASEQAMRGASEVVRRGASELMLRGASELLGASERRLGGASEELGGSEDRLGGASEGLYPAPPSRRE